MKSLVIVLVVVLASGAHAAELGDVNGDGRVSYGDAVWYARWSLTGDPAFRPAEGSDGFESALPCTGSAPGLLMDRLMVIEGIRRVSSAPLPHFLDPWPLPAQPQPRPPTPDPTVFVELLPVVHAGDSSEIELRAKVTTFVPLLGLQLVLRARGLDLRPPHHFDRGNPLQAVGEGTLVSGGELLVYGTRRLGGTALEVGEQELALPALLLRDTLPGKYSLELAAGSEAVVDGAGDVIVPDSSPTEIEIQHFIQDGPSQRFPPLAFDEAARRVLGKTELRVTEAQGGPGDEVEVRVQVRSERPVNKLAFILRFDGWALRCTDMVPALADPDDGAVHAEDFVYALYVNAHPDWGEHFGLVELNYMAAPRGYHVYESPDLAGASPMGFKYIGPLGEWVDVARLTFTVRDGASGKVSTPFVFPSPPYPFAPVFAPYADSMESAAGMWGYGDGRPHPCAPEPVWWSGETELRSGELKVLGGGEPIEPRLPMPIDQARIVYSVGEVAGRPGDIVEVPVRVRADVDFWWTWVVLGYDAARLDLVGYEVDSIDPDGAPLVSLLTPEAPYYSGPVDCVRGADGQITSCSYGYPLRGRLHGAWAGDSVPPGTLILNVAKDVWSTQPGLEDVARYWAGGKVHGAGHAVFRIRGDALPGIAEVKGADVVWQTRDLAVPTRLSSGAKPTSVADLALFDTFERYDVPALRVDPGRVTILGASTFRRGDSNADQKVDLSDPVRTLSALFQGGAPLGCLDAADANDDGRLDISDAVFTLGNLFLGGAELPAPGPDACGLDPTEDGLASCQEDCS